MNTLPGSSSHSDIPVIDHENNAHITAEDKAEIFCQTFASKCHLEEAEDSAPDIPSVTSTVKESVVFKPKVVRKLLKQLKPDKATGPDQIPTRVLKECCSELASPLCRLFSLCFAHGTFPNQWKLASVVPVHKRDSKSDPTKYRPISLLSNISKIMEAVVKDQLQGYLFENDLVSHRQYGFRPKHSTADLLATLSQKWSNTLDRGEEVRLIALDIKGAFDKVWHNGLCAKLKSKGVTGKLLAWIQSYLSNRSMKVVISGQSSNTAHINASVPQGSILGPLLFSVFIDDLTDECENELYLYADDSTLYAEIRTGAESAKQTASLNRDLHCMKMWADKWKVTFEPSKCKAMTISRKRNPSTLDLYFGDCKLAQKEELSILGVTVDSKLTWGKHISNTTARAGQKLGALRRVANKLDVKGKSTVYKAQVRSVMEYAPLCWIGASPTTLSLLDNIQRKALKIIGVDEKFAQSKLNIASLHHRRQVAAVTALYKMHTDSCPQDLKSMLPPPYARRRSTRGSMSMPDHALDRPKFRTKAGDRTFIKRAIDLWNSLPSSIVGQISEQGIHLFKCRLNEHLLIT